MIPGWLPGGYARTSPKPRCKVTSNRSSSVAAREFLWVAASTEGFFENSVDVDAANAEQICDSGGDVLVELDLQRSTVSGSTSSRASSAP